MKNFDTDVQERDVTYRDPVAIVAHALLEPDPSCDPTAHAAHVLAELRAAGWMMMWTGTGRAAR